MKNLGMIGAGAAGAVALTFGAAGIAGAQEEDPVLVDPTPESTDAPDDDARPDRGERRQARIDQLIEDGVITQEQADDLASVREAIQANREEMRAEKQAAIADDPELETRGITLVGRGGDFGPRGGADAPAAEAQEASLT